MKAPPQITIGAAPSSVRSHEEDAAAKEAVLARLIQEVSARQAAYEETVRHVSPIDRLAVEANAPLRADASIKMLCSREQWREYSSARDRLAEWLSMRGEYWRGAEL